MGGVLCEQWLERLSPKNMSAGTESTESCTVVRGQTSNESGAFRLRSWQFEEVLASQLKSGFDSLGAWPETSC
jgi:hypothetical protein